MIEELIIKSIYLEAKNRKIATSEPSRLRWNFSNEYSATKRKGLVSQTRGSTSLDKW